MHRLIPVRMLAAPIYHLPIILTIRSGIHAGESLKPIGGIIWYGTGRWRLIKGTTPFIGDAAIPVVCCSPSVVLKQWQYDPVVSPYVVGETFIDGGITA